MMNTTENRRGLRVCMLVLNEIIKDGRVLRAAEAVSDVAQVTVVGIDRRKCELDRDQARRNVPFELDWVDAADRFQSKGVIRYGMRYASVAARMTLRALRRRPCIVHAHDIQTLPIAMAIRACNRAAVVYDAHELYRDTDNKSINTRCFTRCETWAMKHCRAIIACNKFRADIMRNEYGAPFDPVVIRNLPFWQEYRETHGLRNYVAAKNPAIRWICLHQGAINVGRGIETILDGVPYLSNEVGIVFLGGGDRTYMDSLNRQLRERGLEQRVFFHPPVSHLELFPLTCSADLGIVIYQNTCRNNYYCAPNKLYEYAAAGLPIVGADLPPIREFLREEDCGVLFDPMDGRSLAKAIQGILDDPEQSARRRSNCLEAAKKYCWEHERNRLIDLYRSLAVDVPRVAVTSAKSI